MLVRFRFHNVVDRHIVQVVHRLVPKSFRVRISPGGRPYVVLPWVREGGVVWLVQAIGREGFTPTLDLW